jgi:GNAT superfamily N-acetyltransferase
MTYLPPLHTAEEDVAYFSEQVVGAAGMSLVVAESESESESESDGAVAGFAAVSEGWLHHLYVLPSRQGQGIGSALLDWAKLVSPAGLLLWVFEENVGARRHYGRSGFVEVERTDGSRNMEGVPDIRMQWTPPTPPTPPTAAGSDDVTPIS